ncbi:hypothetical protein [Paracidovorax citrulli]|uniref:hypothetical protein n=1 Tax=Paracidovorax citrulli TaxID=80869 RepID=UPI003FA73835
MEQQNTGPPALEIMFPLDFHHLEHLFFNRGNRSTKIVERIFSTFECAISNASFIFAISPSSCPLSYTIVGTNRLQPFAKDLDFGIELRSIAYALLTRVRFDLLTSLDKSREIVGRNVARHLGQHQTTITRINICRIGIVLVVRERVPSPLPEDGLTFWRKRFNVAYNFCHC